MLELTTQEIADKLGVTKQAAYGLIQFLSFTKLVNNGSVRKGPDGKGKGSKTYLVADTLPDAVREALVKLTG